MFVFVYPNEVHAIDIGNGIWDLASGTLLRRSRFNFSVSYAGLADDGRTLLMVGETLGYRPDRVTLSWDVEDGSLTNVGYSNSETQAMSLNGPYLVSLTQAQVSLTHRTTGTTYTIPVSAPVYAYQVSPDGGLIALNGDREIQLWDIASSQLKATLIANDNPRQIAFASNGTRLVASMIPDDTIQRWSLADNRPATPVSGEQGRIIRIDDANDLIFLSDEYQGDSFVSQLQKRRLSDGALLAEYTLNGRAEAVSADNRFVITSVRGAGRTYFHDLAALAADQGEEAAVPQPPIARAIVNSSAPGPS